MSTQTGIVNGVDFIIMPTEDIERARRFYGETLGLEPSKTWGDMPAQEFETGSLTIALMQADAFGQEFKPQPFPVALHVDDFDQAKSHLESEGVEFLNQIDSGVCHMGFFNDPDGNTLMLHHRYAKEMVDGH